MTRSYQARRRARAVSDLIRLARQNHIWRALAFSDIRGKYRLSTFGSFWISLSTGITAVTIGLIYGQFFGVNVHSYLPYFTTGMIVWTWIASCLNESTNALLSAASLIKASNLPIGFHVMRVVQRNFIILLHNLIIIALVWTWAQWSVPVWSLLSIAGLAIVYVFCVAASMIIAFICVRYRDFPPMVASATQFLFFASPILWYPESLKVGATVLAFNPIASLLVIARDPILGRAVDPSTWYTAIGVTGLSVCIATLVYLRYRDRVAYWV